jgi:hypothetical protein
MKPLTLTVTLALAALAASLRADTVYWNVSEGDWQTGSNWDPVSAPAAADTAYINNSGTAIVSSGIVNINTVYLGQSSGNAGYLNVSGSATVNAASTGIGRSGLGILTISDHGTWTNSGLTGGNFVIGNANSGTGIINLTDYASLQTASTILLGNALTNTGHGILNISGNASVTTQNSLILKTDAIVNMADSASITVNSNGSQIFFSSNANATINITGDKVRLTNKFDNTAASFTGNGSGNNIVHFNHHGNLLFDNQLDASANLTVNAVSGTTTLTAANTYTKDTTVGTGATLIAANETALGTGSVVVDSGGVLAIGDGIDALNLGGDVTIHGLLSLGRGDVLSGSGGLLLDGGLSIAISGPGDLDSLNLGDFFTGFASATYDGLNITATDGETLFQGTLSDDGTLTFQAVPEPSTWALLGAGIGILLITLHRRKTTAHFDRNQPK